MIVRTTESELALQIDATVYSMDVLHKCFYWYTGAFDVSISRTSEERHTVTLISRSPEPDWTLIESRIRRDLIDYRLRDIVTKETKVIRELIVAKAFAHGEVSEDPSTEVSDPVGFNPNRLE